MTEEKITWPFNLKSTFTVVKLRFRPSTLHHLAFVLKFLHFGDRFSKSSVCGARKRRFSVDGRPNGRRKDAFSYLSALVWTIH